MMGCKSNWASGARIRRDARRLRRSTRRAPLAVVQMRRGRFQLGKMGRFRAHRDLIKMNRAGSGRFASCPPRLSSQLHRRLVLSA